MISKIFWLTLIVFFLQGCEDEYATFEHLETTVKNNIRSGDTIIHDSILNYKFSRLQYPNSGGLAAICWIGPAHQNKKMWVVFSGRMRTNYAHSNATITLSVMNQKHETLLWRAVFLKHYAEDINKWCFFKDSIKLPAGYFGKPYSIINVFAYLGNSTHEKFDLDTLKVDFKEKI